MSSKFNEKNKAKLQKQMDEKTKNIKTSIKSSMNLSFKKKIKPDYKVKKFEEKIKSLDQQFYKIKNKIILSLLN